MRHLRKRHRIGRGASHRKATLASMSTALIRHKRITTTLAKAKALRVYVEPILNRAKTDTTHNHREVFRHLQDKDAIKTLFGEIAEKIADRPGGYTRIVKLGMRAGDAAEMAIIELVDYNETDGSTGGRKKARRSRRGRRGTSAAASKDGAEATRYITGLARARGVTVVAKSKSMATEEIKLNESLTDAGIEVVETDLGEWILQLAGEHPSHIIAPAVHLNRGQVAALFREEAGTDDVPDDREGLVAHARVRLREKFAQAGMGVSGVNLGVASTGTVCIVENEGNARLVTSQPRIHVAVMGMERVVADWDE
ncbi:MAG: 50S ribosomal protein L17, partial [Bacteroidetes bacterium]|nr:50S ribosomal protein L17 [Bacteroidota bacterium]